VPLGTDAAGRVVSFDLVADGPHLLVAGTTGAGKAASRKPRRSRRLSGREVATKTFDPWLRGQVLEQWRTGDMRVLDGL